MKYNFKGVKFLEDPEIPEDSWLLMEWMPLDQYIDTIVEEEIYQNMRQFDTGATRDADENKLDYEGFISPLVTKRFAEYMHTHRKQADGKLRDSDNWQKGIPKSAYMKSLVRHVEDLKLHYDGYTDEAVDSDLESVMCAVMFNIQGLLFETIKERKASSQPQTAPSTSGSSSPSHSPDPQGPSQPRGSDILVPVAQESLSTPPALQRR